MSRSIRWTTSGRRFPRGPERLWLEGLRGSVAEPVRAESDPSLVALGYRSHRALRATRMQILTRVEIPGALPAIFGGLQVGVTLAVVGAVIGIHGLVTGYITI